MATPEQQAAQAAHQALVEERDIHSIHKTFRNPAWKPNNRRNKNVKTILGDASRREASALATSQENSGISSPKLAGTGGLSTSGVSTPASAANGSGPQPNLAQASQSLSKLVLEKSLKTQQPLTASGTPVFGSGAPAVTYTNIESAMSMAPQRRYCDITGLPAPYTDPKTRLRYHNSEVFNTIRGFQQGVAEQFLEMRNAHTILK
ncbi:major facilitator superfamily transporter quinate [Ophiostoma piceae UAMH 11346]|uniref:Major facilitator superfamily transporter quinate n=1 Tax=Ophiostoma piceae (strain UAMH 11346) TaxID=1262450 RepID=S3D9N0_OPHP1|nr:major facilitator superfamily transporter quinate [Ophiostoma piceae UAMH 11346]